MIIKQAIEHIDTIYSKLTPHGKKKHGCNINIYCTKNNIQVKKHISIFFDYLMSNDLNNMEDYEFRKSVVFMLKREMIENWFINYYGVDTYEMLFQHFNGSNQTLYKSI